MNIKNNRRRRESVKQIESAFIELLQTKELHDITVCEICKRSRLNRSTFYANYTDIFELADKIKSHLEEVNLLYEAEQAQEFNYLKLFCHIKENQSLYRTYFKLGYDHQKKIEQYDTKLAEQYFDNRHIAYHMEFFKSGLNAIIKIWLSNGCKETPEEMNEILRREYQERFPSDKKTT